MGKQHRCRHCNQVAIASDKKGPICADCWTDGYDEDDDDKFWDAVEKISGDWCGDRDNKRALRRLKKLGVDEAQAKEMLEQLQ